MRESYPMSFADTKSLKNVARLEKLILAKKKYRKPKIDSYGFFSHDLASYITDQNWKRG